MDGLLGTRRSVRALAAALALLGCAGPGEVDEEPLPDPFIALPEAEGCVDGQISLGERIAADATLLACNRYVIPGFFTEVQPGVTLTVEPGSVVGDPSVIALGSVLIVAAGARLVAEGTPDAPIDLPPTTLLGRAPMDTRDELGRTLPSPVRGAGGDDPSHDCGSLAYVRFAPSFARLGFDDGRSGWEAVFNLAVAGCGTATRLHHLQVGGVEGFSLGMLVAGGGFDFDHIVLDEGGLEVTAGFEGRAQFVAARRGDSERDAALAMRPVLPELEDAPLTRFELWNATLVTERARGWPVSVENGGGLTVRNSLVRGTGGGCAFIDDPSLLRLGTGDVVFQDLVFVSCDGLLTSGATGFDLFGPEARNVSAPATLEPGPLGVPWIPTAGTRTDVTGAVPPDGLDTAATYVGAFAPGAPSWTAGWTRAPEMEPLP